MELVTSPNPVDEPNLLYKLQRKIKVFKGGELRNRGYNLVASACKYGLVFVADPSSSFAVYYLKQLIDKECASPQHLSMKLPEAPTHLGISCDHELLAVTGVQYMHFYQVKNFQNENNTPLSVRCNIDASTYVSALQWNPCLPDTIAAAFSDGSLLVSQVKDSDVTKKITAKARCLCWSPKGKQLVTGNADGTLCQYKPDLTLVKTIPAPNICDGSPVEVLAIHWISNYQFGVVYRNAADDSRPYVTIVNTPKAGPTVCINYEDICYSLESFRPWYYYLISIAPWNIIMASSSNSMEIATMGSEDSMNWLQWCQMDEARPELPLSDRKEENYPVGLALDTCAVHQLPWGENETLPHMPLLLVVSHTGLLSLFNIINLRPGAAQVCSPPQPLALCPARLLTSVPEAVESPQKTAPAPAPAPVPTLVSAPAPASVPAPIAPTFSAPPPAYTPTPAAVSVLQNAQSIPSKPAAYAGIAPQAATMSLGQPQTQPKLPEVKQHAQQKSQMSQLPPSQPKPPTDYTAKPAENTTNNAAAVKSKEAQLKAADELRATTVKANEELKAMLLKEVNIFQNEVYKFIQKSRNVNIEFDTNTISEISAKLQQLNAIQLEKDCSVESLKSAIVELKLDLVKTCAILAEAQSRTDSREVQQWSQTDPLSARALESVRRQACLVQARLEEAHRVMRHEWGQLYADTRKGADHMTIPALDAVYQPLVHQQEILTRQQAIIRALQKTQQETSTDSRASMLRMTPFGKDPLSKLTKNILNMSLGPETDDKTNGLDAQKLDRLRDLLSNHKTVRIKPVNMDVRRHLASMQESHDKLVQEMNEQKLKKEPKVVVKQDEPKRKVAETRAQAVPQNASSWPPAWLEPATQPIAQPTNTKPGYVNITNNNIATVARNLFGSGDVPKPDIQAVVMPSKPEVKQPELADKKTPTSNANSVLVGLLQNKTNLNTNKNNVPVNKNILETDKGNQDAIKNNANTFMGQKICSPNSVAHSSAPFPAFGTTTKPSFAFAGAKPPSSNLFGSSDTKPFSFSQPQPQTKPQQPTAVKLPEKPSELPKPATDQQKTELAKIMADLKSAETGEAEDKKPEVPIPLVNASKNGESKEAKPGLLGIKPLAEKATDPPKSAELKPLAEKAKPTQLESTGDNKTLAENNVSKPFSFLEAAGQGDGKIASKPTGVIFASPPLPGASGTSIFGGAATSPTNAVPPAPVTSSPAPVTSPPAPLTSPPAPVTSPPAPVTSPPAPATSPPAPVTSTPASAASIFGSAAATTAKVTPASVFGSASPPTAAAVSPAATVVPQTSPTTPAAGSLFGSAGTATSSATAKPASPAASSVNTTPSATSIFASANAALTTTAPSPFAQASPVGASSIFGSTPASTSATSVFGSVAPTPATPRSIFGAAAKASPSTVFGGTSTSVFGTAAGQPTPQSVFGSPATTAQSSSIFGASEATSLFGAASISTTSAPATGNVFGGSNAGGSIFSNSNTSNVFGAKPAFGQSTTASSIFGGGSSTFGQPQQSGGNIFGAGGVAFGSTFSPQTTQAASIFGGASGGSGFTSGSPGFGSASPTATGSIFGGDSTPKPAASVFGSPQQTPAFGGGAVFGSKPVFGQPTAFGGSPSSGGFSSPFSGGGANVAQSGFGAPPAFGKSPTSGFGAPAAFGGSPSFGGAPSFGSTSPGKVFGGAAPGFGSPPQQTGSSTFENLASQNTLSFGNLAQHSPQPSQPAPTFNTSPSFSGWRG